MGKVLRKGKEKMVTTLVKEFVIPASLGNVDLIGFFPGKNVKIDPGFYDLVAATGVIYETPRPLVCRVHQMQAGYIDTQIIPLLGLPHSNPDWNVVCALLSYLGSHELEGGNAILGIQDGLEEASLILGYLWDNKGLPTRVVFVEREIEGGVEQIHLHVKRINKWCADDVPLVSVFG